MFIQNQLPIPIALYDGEVASQATATAGVANTVYFIGVTNNVYLTLTGLRIRCTTGGTNHYDLGIYDDNGGQPNNLLANSAATATSLLTVSTSLLQPNFLNGPLSIAPGRYWFAFWVDGATDTFNKIASAAAKTTIMWSGTITPGPLPIKASLTTGLSTATTGLKFSIIGLIQGSWS